jgi:GMP synthase (glutamine-hydrolysing)
LTSTTSEAGPSATARSAAPVTRIVVLRTGQAVSRVHAHCGPFYRLFQRCLNDGESRVEKKVAVDELDITCRREDDELPHLGRYHAAIITGSPSYVGDDEPWMRWGQRVIRKMVDDDVPLLAVCFGHQLLGVTYGADVGKNPRGREMGTVDVSLTNHAVVVDDPLWSAMPRSFQAQCTHRDVIRAPGAHLVVLGKAPHDVNHVVKAGRRQWGIQFHPEFDDVTMRLYLETRREVLDKELGAQACDTRIANVTVTSQAASLLRRFAAIAHEEAQRRG